jgi:hypothetical protein
MIYQTKHSLFSKVLLHIQAIVCYNFFYIIQFANLFLFLFVQYNAYYLLLSWFALANMWLLFSITIDLPPFQGIYIFGTAEIVSFNFCHDANICLTDCTRHIP